MGYFIQFVTLRPLFVTPAKEERECEEKPERLEKLKNAKQGNDSVDSYKG